MKTPNKLFLAWHEPTSRSWFPIGQLTFDGVRYYFVYTQGAKEAQQKCGFKPLFSFPNFNTVYTSTYLFPVFANRLMSRSRPDYLSYMQWLNIPKQEISEYEDNPIAILARSGGERQTDNLTVFPYPEPDAEGAYHFHFFSHGLRYLPQASIERINHLEPKEKLWLAREFQNPHDSQALTLNTKDHYIVGYCPRYLLSEIFEILQEISNLIDLHVERVNQPPTPLHSRLLCHIIIKPNNHLQLFSRQEYQLLIKEGLISEVLENALS